MLLMLAMPFNVAKSEYDPVFTALSAFEGIVPAIMEPINEKKETGWYLYQKTLSSDS